MMGELGNYPLSMGSGILYLKPDSLRAANMRTQATLRDVPKEDASLGSCGGRQLDGNYPRRHCTRSTPRRRGTASLRSRRGEGMAYATCSARLRTVRRVGAPLRPRHRPPPRTRAELRRRPHCAAMKRREAEPASSRGSVRAPDRGRRRLVVVAEAVSAGNGAVVAGVAAVVRRGVRGRVQ